MSQPPPNLGPLYLALGLLAGAVVIGGVVMLALRRRLLKGDRPRHGSLMEDVRRMHASGGMTREEYDRVRKALARSAAGGGGGGGGGGGVPDRGPTPRGRGPGGGRTSGESPVEPGGGAGC